MKKTRIQVSIDADLSEEANKVIAALGLTPTAVVTALYRRIIASGSLPFPLELTRQEKANLGLIMATKDMPVKDVDTASEIKEWLDDGEDEQ